jgi:hypothetical protein
MEQLQTVLNTGVLEIKFAQKLYYQIARPFVQCPPGFGIDVQSLASSRTGVNETQVSDTNWLVRPDYRAASVYNIDPIQIIEPEIQIQAAINFPNGNTPSFANVTLTSADSATNSTAVELGLIFDGYVIRPSQ